MVSYQTLATAAADDPDVKIVAVVVVMIAEDGHVHDDGDHDYCADVMN